MLIRAETGSIVLLLAVLASLPALADPLDNRQATLMASKCLQCHAVPGTTAPQIGVTEDWQTVISQGEEKTLVNVVEGIRGMPPLGYCSACSEDDLRALIRFVAGISIEDSP